jgi:hypothetical protein
MCGSDILEHGLCILFQQLHSEVKRTWEEFMHEFQEVDGELKLAVELLDDGSDVILVVLDEEVQEI